MQIRYTGNEDFRVIHSTDLPPDYDDKGDRVEAEPWPAPLVWAATSNHVLEVDDSVGEKVLKVGGFREAGDDEVELAAKMLEDQQEWDASRRLIESRRIASNAISESDQVLGESSGSQVLDESSDDASSDADSSEDDEG